ncbi:MAG TPA: sigma-70 family RNA polymerase sigma factor [Humisphaera sp.]|nr:sigma-70 family RNA polymerase sigma factor [Humisphaera sp.]
MLVAAANDGEEAAFVALYERHRDWVVRLAHRFTGNPDDAQDVLQETFKYMLGKFPGFKLTAAMTTFLYPVVRNLSLEILRGRRREPVADEQLLANIPAGEEGGVIAGELPVVLAALPATHLEVVLMRFVDGLSLEEISLSLEIPIGTVKSRLHNALSRLRRDPRTRRYFEVD